MHRSLHVQGHQQVLSSSKCRCVVQGWHSTVQDENCSHWSNKFLKPRHINCHVISILQCTVTTLNMTPLITCAMLTWIATCALVSPPLNLNFASRWAAFGAIVLLKPEWQHIVIQLPQLHPVAHSARSPRLIAATTTASPRTVYHHPEPVAPMITIDGV